MLGTDGRAGIPDPGLSPDPGWTSAGGSFGGTVGALGVLDGRVGTAGGIDVSSKTERLGATYDRFGTSAGGGCDAGSVRATGSGDGAPRRGRAGCSGASRSG